MVKLAVPFIAMIIFAYSITSILNIPVAFIAVPSSVVLSIIAMKRRINVKNIVKGAPWQIVLFSLGMYIVVFGMGSKGLTYVLEKTYMFFVAFPEPIAIIFSGFFSALLAAIMNNMPSVMINALAIHGIPNNQALIYSNVIGNDIGPKFTPIGSLATLLWIYTIQRKYGIPVSSRYYIKVGLITAPIILLATLLSLYIIFII